MSLSKKEHKPSCPKSIEALRIFSEVSICPPTYPHTHSSSSHPSVRHLPICPSTYSSTHLTNLSAHSSPFTQSHVHSPSHLPTYLSTQPASYSLICLLTQPATHLSVYSPSHLPIYLSTHPANYPPFCPPSQPATHLSVYPLTHLETYVERPLQAG